MGQGPESESRTLYPSRQALADRLFLALIVILCLASFLGGLGFYSDDWTLLSTLARAPDPSISGMFAAMYAEDDSTRSRPVQILHYVALYRAFGSEPIGYHVVNGILLVGVTLAFHLVLREIGLDRALATAVPAVFATLPSYSTIRFWFASSGYTIAMLMFFLSLYADLRGVRETGASRWRWKTLAIGSLLVCGLGIEVALPLFLINPVVARRSWKRSTAGAGSRELAAVVAYWGASALACGAIVGFKALTSPGVGILQNIVVHVGRIVAGAAAVHYGSFGLGLPWAAAWGFSRSTPGVLGAAILISVLVFVHFHRIERQDTGGLSSCRPRSLAATGFAVFGLGYATFLATGRMGISATGINNRFGFAAAAGVALSFVAGLLWIRRVLGGRHGRSIFPAGMSLLCGSGALVLGTLGMFWVDAYRVEREVLANLRDRLPVLHPETTLILDGTCPYRGPAVVFESSWDLAGAIQLMYREPTLRADVVTPRLTVGEEGLTTTTYDMVSSYPYGEMILFDHRRGAVHSLESAADANHYIRSLHADRAGDCPPGEPGWGVPLLPLDRALWMLNSKVKERLSRSGSGDG